VIVVGVMSIALDRRWRARKSATDITPAADPTSPSPESTTEGSTARLFSKVTDRVTSTLGGVPIVGDRLLRRKDADGASRFQTWVAKACAEDPSLNQWMQGLSKEALQAFTDHVSAFCTEMGFEPSWVTQQRLDAHPEVARAFERMVLNYCRACHEAAAAQEELEVYKTFQAFEDNPSSRKSHAFGQRLFAKVVEAGLSSVSMSEYLTATPKEQQQYMLRAVREAAKNHSAAFNRLLKEVARDAVHASTAAQPTTTSASGERDAETPAGATS
jgi:hypothetical protein